MKQLEIAADNVPFLHWRSYRFHVLLILMITITITSSIYLNLGVALVCMVNATYITGNDDTRSQLGSLDQCPNLQRNEEELGYTGDLLWSSIEQSQLFAVFFYASLIAMAVSGWMADRFSPKLLILVATLNYSAFSLLSPLFARLHFYAFMIARFFMGLSEGFIFPCITAVVSRWVAPGERTTAAGIYTSGHQLATILSALVSSRLCTVELWGGWPLIFYVFGAGGIVCAIMFGLLVSSGPEESRIISQRERNYLHHCLANQGTKAHTKTNLPVPWKAMLTSRCVHAIMICEFNWQFSMSLFCNFLPSFFRDIMAFDMSQNGYYATVPFVTQILSKLIVAVISDKLKEVYGFSPTASCKTLQTISTLGSALCLIGMAFLDCTQPILAMVWIGLFGAFFAGEIAGSFTATLFIAPPFTGTLSSMTCLVGSIGGIIAPTVIGIINQTGTHGEWMRVFFTGAFVNIAAGIAFLFFGSAEIQPWAAVQKPSAIRPTEIERF